MTKKQSLFKTDHIEGKVIYLLAVVALVQFIYPITESGNLLILLISQAIYASLIIVGIVIVRDNPRLVRTFIIFGVIWFVAGVIYALNQDAIWANIIGFGTYVVFYALQTGILLRYIFVVKTITRDVIYGAIAAYLLIGGVFVGLFGVLETMTFALSNGEVNAFTGGIAPEGAIFAWQDMIYYSYVTLTTLGYGDILPQTMLAKVAVSAESIIGVLYLTIIMARLVSLYSADVNAGEA